MGHSLDIGSTGVGKSSRLECELSTAIKDGQGVVLIDPHGSLAHAVVGHIPPERSQHLVYVDLSDSERAVPLNPLHASSDPDERSAAVENLVAIGKHVWGNEAFGDRTQDIFRYACRAQMEIGGTLLGVRRMLNDEDYRCSVISKVPDMETKLYWKTIFPSDEKRIDDWISPLNNKLDALLTPALTRVLCQRTNRIDFRQALDLGQIVIINLAMGQVGEVPARIFGSFQFSRVLQAAFTRPPGSAVVKLCVDEFQNVATPAFRTVLAEARKYGLELSLATQSLSTPEARLYAAAVFTNISDIHVFRCGFPDDAQVLAEYLVTDSVGAVTAQHIQNLPNFTYYGRYVRDDKTTDAQLYTTARPPRPVSNPENLIQNARLKYGTERSVIEAKIAKFLGG